MAHERNLLADRAIKEIGMCVHDFIPLNLIVACGEWHDYLRCDVSRNTTINILLYTHSLEI